MLVDNEYIDDSRIWYSFGGFSLLAAECAGRCFRLADPKRYSCREVVALIAQVVRVQVSYVPYDRVRNT